MAANMLGWTLLLGELVMIGLIIAFFVGRAKQQRAWSGIEDPIEEWPIPQPSPKPPVETDPLPPPPERYVAPRAPGAVQLADGHTLHREMSGDKVVYVSSNGDVFEPVMGMDS